MFIKAIIKMDKTGKQPRCPLIGECTVVHTDNGILSNDKQQQQKKH